MHTQREALFALWQGKEQCHRHIEQRGFDAVLCTRLLLLPDGHRGDTGGVVPGKLDLVFGMAALVHPLLEEGLQVAPRGRFDGPLEIDRFHDLMAVGRDILPQTVPEGRIASM